MLLFVLMLSSCISNVVSWFVLHVRGQYWPFAFILNKYLVYIQDMYMLYTCLEHHYVDRVHWIFAYVVGCLFKNRINGCSCSLKLNSLVQSKIRNPTVISTIFVQFCCHFVIQAFSDSTTQHVDDTLRTRRRKTLFLHGTCEFIRLAWWARVK